MNHQQQKQCFYCKQTFQSSTFGSHLKQCPQRKKQNNPGPLQQGPPQFNQYPRQPQYPPNRNMNPYPPNRNMQQSSLWCCPMCSYQNAPNAAVCTMCQQGKRGPSMPSGMQQQPPNQYNAAHYAQMNRGGGGARGLPPPTHVMQQQQQQQPQQPQQPPPSQNNKQDQYWECQSCTFVNSTTSASCRICSNQQPNTGDNGDNNKNKSNPPKAAQQMYSQQQQQEQEQEAPPSQSSAKQEEEEEKQNDVKLEFGQKGGGGMPPPPPDDVEAMDYSGFGGGHGGGPQEPDAATAALIAQMLAAEKCVLCRQNQGFALSCGDNVCAPCGKKYILNGIATMKWKKCALKCPQQSCSGILPLWIVKECGLGQGMQSKLEEMQNKYMIASDPSITSCPKCKETYSTEEGDLASSNASEKGPDGKLLSYVHRQHKSKYRFRCSSGGCRTVFCSGCCAVPYHIAYTCAEYKLYIDSAKCRFCEVSLAADGSNTAPRDATLKSGLDSVCSNAECLEKRRWSCDLQHACEHNCIGLMGHDCIPCMNIKCVANKNSDLNDDEYCNICWVDPLRAAPCVKLECNHYFHFMCLWQKIDRKWPAARITFGFLNCPLCKGEIHHPALDDITKKYYDLKSEIQKDAVERVKIEGLQNDKRLTDASSHYYKNLEKFALDRLAFYPCSKCKKPYFGGMKACEEAGLEQAENYKHEHLVCGSCASGPNAKSCKLHGKKYVTYKCKFCCNVSSWYCWGSTHFCDKCHKRQEQGDYLNRKPISDLPKCPGVDACPLGIEHPANGTSEFSLGCVVCLRK